MDTMTRREGGEVLAEPSGTYAAGTTRRPRVVIVGAGFGGINAARALGNRDLDVLVLNRTNYHGFWMLLYQVAAAQVEPETVARPVRTMLRRFRNVQFRVAEVEGVHLDRRVVRTAGDEIAYDYLVLAAGSATHYFGNDTYRQRTLGLHDLADAARMRDQVLAAFEQAAREPDAARRAALMTIVVVGGGPTGVELAGAFVELIHGSLAKDYPMLDTGAARVILVENHTSLLATFPASLQQGARRKLEQMGVELHLGAAVTAIAGDAITLADGSVLRAQTVVWAAGVRASTLADALGVALGRGARVRVQPTLNLADHPEVFVIGDMAYLENADGAPYPMVAQVAMQMGKQAGANILALRNGAALRPFAYFDFGQLAMVGRGWSVLARSGLKVAGLLGWGVWLAVHWLYLPGLHNRLLVLLAWLGTALTGEASVRTTVADSTAEHHTLAENDAVARL